MWLNLHKNHRLFLGLAAGLFLLLSTLVAIMPAFSVQNNNAPLPDTPPSNAEIENGLDVFVSENCMACHTQQVRNIDMDKTWGGRPGIPADYARMERLDNWRATPSTLGTERTGPDLTEVGERQPSEDWHYLHLFNPRSVVKESIMPAYPWLFTTKPSVTAYEKEVNVPAEFRQGVTGHIVPTERARQLVAYLLSRKQVDLPDGQAPAFIEYKKPKPVAGSATSSGEAVLDGAPLYAQNCQACHQASGEGLKGAFPPLKGSAIVNDANADMMVRIILQGYDARAEYAVMPPFAQKLSDEEIAAIATHERSSWGNKAEKVTPEFVRQIRAALKTETAQ